MTALTSHITLEEFLKLPETEPASEYIGGVAEGAPQAELRRVWHSCL